QSHSSCLVPSTLFDSLEENITPILPLLSNHDFLLGKPAHSFLSSLVPVLVSTKENILFLTRLSHPSFFLLLLAKVEGATAGLSTMATKLRPKEGLKPPPFMMISRLASLPKSKKDEEPSSPSSRRSLRIEFQKIALGDRATTTRRPSISRLELFLEGYGLEVFEEKLVLGSRL
ncbi:unnamed protein product, partial [Linum tenue]